MRIQNEEYSWVSAAQNASQSAPSSQTAQTTATQSKTDGTNSNVYAKSIDGDTVELSEAVQQPSTTGTHQQANTSTNTSAVTTNQTVAAKASTSAGGMTTSTTNSNDSSNTANLSQYSEYQLTQMLNNGKITQSEYNDEIAKRTAKKQQAETNHSNTVNTNVATVKLNG